MFVLDSSLESWEDEQFDVGGELHGFEIPDEREWVYEAWHQMQLAQLGVVDALVWWDRADGYVVDGARSATAWWQAKLQVSYARAVGLLRQARGLRDCPALRTALVDGSLTFDQADQLLDVFTPARQRFVVRDVDMLIEHCVGLSVRQCRIVARNWAERVDVETAAGDDAEPVDPEVSVSEVRVGTILDGVTIVEATLRAADGAMFQAALTSAHRLSQPDATRDDVLVDGRTPAQQRADALTLICQFFLDHHANVTASGSINRAHVNITVDLDRLTAAHQTGRAQTPYSVDGIDVASVLQTCCDASVARMLTAGQSLVIDVGRETRTISPPLRKTVTFRDSTCRFPGCEMPPTFTDVHHIKHWIDGGPTDRANCCLLCRRHHTLIHSGRWSVSGNANESLTFTNSTGHVFKTSPPKHQPPLRK